MELYYDGRGNITHKCHTYKTYACDAAIEDDITGVLVCRFSGRQFGVPAIIVSQDIEIEEEDLEENFIEDQKKVDAFLFQALIRQVVTKDFPIEAYTLELTRVYTKYNMYKYFTSIEEYVISTLYLMCEGFGEICLPNKILSTNILNQSDLKTVKINKTIITAGNKNWQKVCLSMEDQQETTKTHLFSFKRQKINSSVTINTHEEIINIYDMLKRKENKYLVDL